MYCSSHVFGVLLLLLPLALRLAVGPKVFFKALSRPYQYSAMLFRLFGLRPVIERTRSGYRSRTRFVHWRYPLRVREVYPHPVHPLYPRPVHPSIIGPSRLRLAVKNRLNTAVFQQPGNWPPLVILPLQATRQRVSVW